MPIPIVPENPVHSAADTMTMLIRAERSGKGNGRPETRPWPGAPENWALLEQAAGPSRTETAPIRPLQRAPELTGEIRYMTEADSGR